MPEQNVIIGPDGRVFRPRELPTGIASHVKLMVREWELFNLELEKMVQECQSSRREREKRDRRSGEREVQWLPWAFDIFVDHFEDAPTFRTRLPTNTAGGD